jgi:hypothetical protein
MTYFNTCIGGGFSFLHRITPRSSFTAVGMQARAQVLKESVIFFHVKNAISLSGKIAHEAYSSVVLQIPVQGSASPTSRHPKTGFRAAQTSPFIILNIPLGDIENRHRLSHCA